MDPDAPSVEARFEESVRELRVAAVDRFAALLEEALGMATEDLRREALRILGRKLLEDVAMRRARGWACSIPESVRQLGQDTLALERRLVDELGKVDPQSALEAVQRAIDLDRELIACGYFTARDGLVALERRIENARPLPPEQRRAVARLVLAELDAPALRERVAMLREHPPFAPLLERLDDARRRARALLGEPRAA